MSYAQHSRPEHAQDSLSQPPTSTMPSTTGTATSTTPSSMVHTSTTTDPSSLVAASNSRTSEAAKQLFCGGVAGAVAKTVTAPFSRLTILFQVHSLVTTKEHRPKFAMSLSSGLRKIIERGGILSLWKGNLTSVLHRFPYSAINFYMYENTLDVLSAANKFSRETEMTETHQQLVRRMSKIMMNSARDDDDDGIMDESNNSSYELTTSSSTNRMEDSPVLHKFIAGAVAGTAAVLACYPLDLVRTRLTTQFEGQENYRGIVDAFRKIARTEGFGGLYAGILPTLGVAVPNFAISYTVYGTLKEHALDDELFYNLRRIDADGGEPKLGLILTVMCGACSGIMATLATFPMDTIRRRMQIQSLHVAPEERLTSYQQLQQLVRREGLGSLYRGLTPELLKVVPMVGTMFVVYEWTKDMLNVRHDRR